MEITQGIKYIGVYDTDIDLFEGQYIVKDGISYNSYIIMDEKIAVMDTVDKRKTEEWLKNIENELGDKAPDYLVVSHIEPDHAGSTGAFLEKYPSAKIVLNDKSVKMLAQFFEDGIKNECITVKEGEELCLGAHTLVFYMAPMVHWPEVMVEYEKTERVLFSADGFGRFGNAECDDPVIDEARRYYINIVGKYGAQVQALLKKASGLDIDIICPLHGPVLKDNIGCYIEKYDIWSSYRAEEQGVVVAYASIHGNTARAAGLIAEAIERQGGKAVLYDLARCDISEAVSDAFRFDKMVLACATYDGFMFTPMEKFLSILNKKNYQKRKVALVENGTWAPTAARLMKEYIDKMKDVTVCETVLTLKSALRKDQMGDVEKLAAEMAN